MEHVTVPESDGLFENEVINNDKWRTGLGGARSSNDFISCHSAVESSYKMPRAIDPRFASAVRVFDTRDTYTELFLKKSTKYFATVIILLFLNIEKSQIETARVTLQPIHLRFQFRNSLLH